MSVSFPWRVNVRREYGNATKNVVNGTSICHARFHSVLSLEVRWTGVLNQMSFFFWDNVIHFNTEPYL